jgi:hypothetical protein
MLPSSRDNLVFRFFIIFLCLSCFLLFLLN